MNKLLFSLLFIFALSACDTKKTTENEQVIDTDTVGVSYDVEKTVVETDTTIDVDTTTTTDEVEVEKQ